MLITINDKSLSDIKKFSEECVGTNKYYSSRGQSNVAKITSDIFTGKCGEFAAYQLLLSKFEDATPPDLEIYIGRRKSHSADLTAGGFKFSVKTQSMDSIRKYGMSWLMEKTSLPKFDGHHVILCLELEPGIILIQNIVKFGAMLAVQAEPKLKHLKSKCAFYYDDILLGGIE